MKESDWLSRPEPEAMLNWLTGRTNFNLDGPCPVRASDRKLRLFGAAVLRHYWLDFPFPGDKHDERNVVSPTHRQRTVGELEWWADNNSPPPDNHWQDYREARQLAFYLCEWGLTWPYGCPETAQAKILRDLFGNPHRPVQWVPAKEPSVWESIPQLAKAAAEKNYFAEIWVTPTVQGIAQEVYEHNAWDRLPFVRDALLDAGCTNEEVLKHLELRPDGGVGYQRCGNCLGHGMYHHPTASQSCQPCPTCFDDRAAGGHGWSTGWVPCGPHVRGCWVTDLILRRG